MKFYKDLTKYALGCFLLMEGICLFFDVTQGQSLNYYRKILMEECGFDDCWEHLEDVVYFMSFLKYACLLSGFMIVVSVQKG